MKTFTDEELSALAYKHIGPSLGGVWDFNLRELRLIVEDAMELAEAANDKARSAWRKRLLDPGY
jgi:hypothetical protein